MFNLLDLTKACFVMSLLAGTWVGSIQGIGGCSGWLVWAGVLLYQRLWLNQEVAPWGWHNGTTRPLWFFSNLYGRV